ncbi:endonuclease/exonuclease/phosphatase family protein [Streptococcus dysgalactiae]|uniref:endonuclease/exonuclease/phosphatase family protein n=1 Tax=Streptococcus dysgalactiae TaxID=1334 RepID=UPI001950C580
MFNARSLIGKLPSLRALVHSENPDIVLITETWLTKETTPEHISVAGYQSFGVNRLTRRGGGCLVYIKQPFCASTLQHPVLDKIPDSIWLSLPCGQLQLLIGCIYQPPNDCINDVKHITDAFSHVSDLPFHVKIIGGDFNAPQICWSSLRAPRKLLSFVSCVRLGRWTQHVTSPTRGNNILDLIFTQGLSKVKANVLNCFPGSDHKVVTLNFAIPPMNNITQPKHMSCRSFSYNNNNNNCIFLDLMRDACVRARSIDNLVHEHLINKIIHNGKNNKFRNR